MVEFLVLFRIRSWSVSVLVNILKISRWMSSILVMVDNPMSLGDALPLLPGAFVDAEVRGRSIEGAVAVPRGAVYDGNTVWVLSAQSTLERRSISPVWGDNDFVYVSEGLEDGASLVLSPLVRFLRFYVLRLGFLDGLPGLVHISIGCLTSFMKYAKLIERQRSRAPGG